jgi:hypothetical protein
LKLVKVLGSCSEFVQCVILKELATEGSPSEKRRKNFEGFFAMLRMTPKNRMMHKFAQKQKVLFIPDFTPHIFDG